MTDFKTFIVAEPPKNVRFERHTKDNHGNTHNLKQGGNTRLYGFKRHNGVMDGDGTYFTDKEGNWTDDLKQFDKNNEAMDEVNDEVMDEGTPNFCEQILNCSIM